MNSWHKNIITTIRICDVNFYVFFQSYVIWIPQNVMSHFRFIEPWVLGSQNIWNCFIISYHIISVYAYIYVCMFVIYILMICSQLYHACDVNSWSVYHTCVLPYHVLSYGDFFSSILSFVVTLTAMAELPPTATSLIQMINTFFLILAIEWQQHSLVTFLVPSLFCLVIVIVARVSSRW